LTRVTWRRDSSHRREIARRAIVSPTMNDETPFVPRGAVAFFVAMIGFYIAVWALVAAIMAARR